MIAGLRARKRGCARRAIRASYTYISSHSKTIVFGLLATDGRRMFRQYDRFEMHASARFIKAAVRKFGRICLILDSPPQHYAKMIRRLVEMVEGLTLKFRPAATPEISVIEMCRMELKCKVPDVSQANLNMLRKAIA